MSRPRFRVIETTADLGLLVWGGDREELFGNAACGLTRILADPRGVQGRVRKTVCVRGADDGARLVAWLSEWLFLFDTEGFIGREFRIDGATGSTVRGTGWGERFDPERHRLRTEVKGITYHRLEVVRRDSRFRARLVLDV